MGVLLLYNSSQIGELDSIFTQSVNNKDFQTQLNSDWMKFFTGQKYYNLILSPEDEENLTKHLYGAVFPLSINLERNVDCV
jgi:hypothetical protein